MLNKPVPCVSTCLLVVICMCACACVSVRTCARPLLSDWLKLPGDGWVGLSGFLLILGKVQVCPEGGGGCQLFGVGGWVAELGRLF